ncbi:hypothetical protein [Corynebacterium sp. 335C]
MRRVATAAVTASALTLAACGGGAGIDAVREPMPVEPSSQTEPVVVAADGKLPEQTALAEVYAGGFARVGRDASTRLDVPLEMRVDAVRSGSATMSFGCTGELLVLMDRETALQLAIEYQADEDPGKALSPEWRDRVYGAMSAALPGDLMATDPSNAQACAWLDDARNASAEGAAFGGMRDDVPSPAPAPDAPAGAPEGEGAGAPVGVAPLGPDSSDLEIAAALPRHLVPFYRKPALDRRDRVEVLNRIAGSISTKEVRELTKAVAEPGAEPAADLARKWLETSRFTTG